MNGTEPVAPPQPTPAPVAPPLGPVLTVPNVVTLLRFGLIGPVCWMILTGVSRGAWTPVVLLALWASTDWIDGLLARVLDQRSRLGEIFDPLADRLGITALMITLAVVGVVDWWKLLVIVVVDALVIVFAHRAARAGNLSVSWVGKVRTAVLLVAIVLLVMGVSLFPVVLAVAQDCCWRGCCCTSRRGWATSLPPGGVRFERCPRGAVRLALGTGL